MELSIYVFGVGSARDIVMLRSVNMALTDLQLDISVDYITDLQAFISKGLTGIPALMINEEIKIAGRTPSVLEIRQIIEEELSQMDEKQVIEHEYNKQDLPRRA